MSSDRERGDKEASAGVRLHAAGADQVLRAHHDRGAGDCEARLPRDQFYAEFVKWKAVIDHSVRRWFTPRQMMKCPDLYRKLLPNLPKMIRRRIQYHPVHSNPESYLRDEAGLD
ncbi:MAG TPA: hypothetical protein QGF58_25140 [Myxococcota bacterium]|nr:hypothetical protein [Myxococcota bacterium]